MRLLYAPDSYGDVLTAVEACAAALPAFRAAGLEAAAHPMADGGRGTLFTLAAHLGGAMATSQEVDPLGAPVDVRWLRLRGGWFLESAQILGLSRGRLDPLRATSAGLASALRSAPGVPLVVGLGGSATVDGGLGLGLGLGLTGLDADGRPLPGDAGAASLARVARLVGPPPDLGSVTVWADVRTLQRDCIARFGPQKGLAAGDVPPQTDAMRRWAEVLAAWCADHGRDLDVDAVGGGAAGGVGLALAALLRAPLLPGALAVAALTDLAAAVRASEVVVIGEGRLDATSLEGKVADVVVAEARRAGARVAALAGEERRPDGVEPKRWPDLVERVDGEGPRPLARAAARLAARLA